ncbi:hypothetical protein MRX96_032515 [Rhipicephalus microplus]
MPPLRKKRRVAQGGHRKKTRQSTTFVEKAQTAQKKLTASTSRGHDHTSTVHKASACRPARDKQATLPPGQSIADCSDSEQNQKPLAPELLLKHKRGQQRKAIKVASKKSKVCALGSSRNPPADPPNEETHAAPPPANTSQLLTVKSGSGKPSAQVAGHTAVSSGDKETEGRRMTRSLSKSLEKLRMRKSTVCDGASVVLPQLSEAYQGAQLPRPLMFKSGEHRDTPESHSHETRLKAGPSSSRLNSHRRLLFKKDSLKSNTLQKDTQNIQVNTLTSEQQLMSDDAGQAANAPESRTNETGFKAGPSSSPLNWQQRLLFKKDSLKINTLQKDTQNIQVNTRTSEQQLMSNDAARSSQSATLQGSQGSAETSSTARKIGSTGKKTARMSASGESSECSRKPYQ